MEIYTNRNEVEEIVRKLNADPADEWLYRVRQVSVCGFVVDVYEGTTDLPEEDPRYNVTLVGTL